MSKAARAAAWTELLIFFCIRAHAANDVCYAFFVPRARAYSARYSKSCCYFLDGLTASLNNYWPRNLK